MGIYDRDWYKNEPPKVDPQYKFELVGNSSGKKSTKRNEPPKVDLKYKYEFIGVHSQKNENKKTDQQNANNNYSKRQSPNDYDPINNSDYSEDNNLNNKNFSYKQHDNNLVQCKDCGKYISISAERCPNCGAYTTHELRRFAISKIVGFISFVIIALLLISAFTNNSSSSSRLTNTQQKNELVFLEVTLRELVNAYRINRFEADEKYKDKNIVITGQIDTIGAALFSNSPTISFQTDIPIGDFISGGYLGSIYSLVMVFDQRQASSIAKLRIGNNTTVEGKFIGLNDFNNLQMNDCRIR